MADSVGQRRDRRQLSLMQAVQAMRARYSLRYLLFEVTLIAASLAAARAAVLVPPKSDQIYVALIAVATVAGTTALGGLFLRMQEGLIAGIVVFAMVVGLLF